MARLRHWLALWFGFELPVGRRTYFTHGAALMALKYSVDFLLVAYTMHRVWNPLAYLGPVFSLRPGVSDAPSPLLVALLVWALPFMWIGVSMTMRRALDAGRSPWLCLLFLCPLVNYFVMLWLSLAPTVPATQSPMDAPSASAEGRIQAALRGLGASLLASAAVVLVSIAFLGSYGVTLFVLTPFVLGAITAWMFNREHVRTMKETIGVSLLALVLGCGAIVLFALEGVMCVAMALPILVVVVIAGAMTGRAIALRRGQAPAAAAFVLFLTPALPLTELPRSEPPLRELCTSVIVNAPPERVWRHVVTFSELDEPPRWFFRLGIAYPRRATITGTGVGAVRRCEFSTGPFVEPITAWEAPTRLAFDVASQPPPLTEWSPYANLAPPHLSRSFRSRRGEFRLVALPGGRTRLEGRTWYALDMQPYGYWALWSDGIVHAIHSRVLAHVKSLVEHDAEPAAAR
jgi:uncharacterized membrane protein YhaH (DUF805 family)/uncharacterized protein YndB with AHSA1/START domain